MNRKSVGIVKTNIIKIPLPANGFKLESGGTLQELSVAYEAYGKLSIKKDNVILICHALTGDAHAAGYHSKKDKNQGGGML